MNQDLHAKVAADLGYSDTRTPWQEALVALVCEALRQRPHEGSDYERAIRLAKLARSRGRIKQDPPTNNDDNNDDNNDNPIGISGCCRRCGSPVAFYDSQRRKLACTGSGARPEICPYINPDKLPYDEPLPAPPTDTELERARSLRARFDLPPWKEWKRALDELRGAENGDWITDESGGRFQVLAVKAAYTPGPPCRCGGRTVTLANDNIPICTQTGLLGRNCGHDTPTRGDLKWAARARRDIFNEYASATQPEDRTHDIGPY